MKNIIKSIILLLFVSFIVTACGEDDPTKKNENELTIYTSIYPIQFIVERIAGDTLSVFSVYPPGVDAHSYEPTAKDMTKVADSDAFFYLGAGLEAFAETTADALQNEDVTMLEIGSHEELFHMEDEDDHHEELEHDGHHHGDHDPHIWIDPKRMIEMASIIKDELIQLNPADKTLYQTNFEKLEKDLLDLDDEFVSTLESKAHKKILVSHSAYGYWEERYGIEQISINGLSSSSEPSQKELTEIIDQAREYDLNYIIFEQNSSNRVSEIIQSELGIESITIHNLSVLTDEDIQNNEDYLSLMRDNLQVLDDVTNE